MYIFDNKNINCKAQFTAGLSIFERLVGLETKGGGYLMQTFKNPYFQFRTFGTYKPLGISFGFDVFKVKGDFIRLNATLSKVFDLDNFIKNFSPVNGLRIQ